MQSIIISVATKRLIQERAGDAPFRDQSYLNRLGQWVVPVSDETYERLMTHKAGGESEDDVIVRLMSIDWRIASERPH